MNWWDLRSEVRSACLVPDVDPGRCIHTHAEVGSCRRCVDACPAAAWMLDDEQLAIDASACDGCGLCVAACPEGALSHDVAPALRRWGGLTAAFAACERVGAKAAGATVPCVHAFGLTRLAALYRDGVRRLLVCVGECEDCPRGAGERLSTRLATLNRVLAQRGLSGMVARKLTTSQWRRFFTTAAPAVAGPAMSRRHFLRGALTSVAESGAVKKPLEWQAPGSVLPRAGAGELAFFAPYLDAELCNGCGGCIRVCPHGALRLAERGDAYEVHADACTGCGLCADVCDQHAMSVDTCSVVKRSRVPLQVGRCRACGADFHRPISASAAASEMHCHVCARTRHHRNLFQVI